MYCLKGYNLDMVNIKIEYCAVWHYLDRAAGLAAEILKEYEPDIESLTLIPADGGKFEVSLDDELVFSKIQIGRHAEPGEVMNIFHQKLAA